MRPLVTLFANSVIFVSQAFLQMIEKTSMLFDCIYITELQIRGGIEDNSEIIFLISLSLLSALSKYPVPCLV